VKVFAKHTLLCCAIGGCALAAVVLRAAFWLDKTIEVLIPGGTPKKLRALKPGGAK
jgi:hypothetical protein